MKDRKLFLYWLYIYILCAALGFIPTTRTPLVAALLALAALGFFLPPALILHRAIQRKDKKTLQLLLLLCAGSLVLTMLLFIANTLTALAPQNLLLGNIFHSLLLLFSAPMFCAPWQFLGPFGWACLLFTALLNRKNGSN